jgi:Regulator of ribonuclease activity B
VNITNEFPADENGDVLCRMQESGDNLSIPRDIDFVVILTNEMAANAFVNSLAVAGYAVKVENSATVPELPWDAVVVRRMIPNHKAIADFESQLDAIAHPLGGRNDGWGCFEQHDEEVSLD